MTTVVEYNVFSQIYFWSTPLIRCYYYSLCTFSRTTAPRTNYIGVLVDTLSICNYWYRWLISGDLDVRKISTVPIYLLVTRFTSVLHSANTCGITWHVTQVLMFIRIKHFFLKDGSGFIKIWSRMRQSDTLCDSVSNHFIAVLPTTLIWINRA